MSVSRDSELFKAYRKIMYFPSCSYGSPTGLFSFYNAVQILRKIDSKNSPVPRPFKSHHKFFKDEKIHLNGYPSLRKYARDYYDSIDGEILSKSEMLDLISSYGYSPFSLESSKINYDDKIEFIKMCIKNKFPVLAPVAEMDMNFPIRLSWSLIIAYEDGNFLVVCPRGPKNARWINENEIIKKNLKCELNEAENYEQREFFYIDSYKNSSSSELYFAYLNVPNKKIAFADLVNFENKNFKKWSAPDWNEESMKNKYFTEPHLVNSKNGCEVKGINKSRNFNLANVFIAIGGGSMDLMDWDADVDDEVGEELIAGKVNMIPQMKVHKKLPPIVQQPIDVAVNNERNWGGWIPKYFKCW